MTQSLRGNCFICVSLIKENAFTEPFHADNIKDCLCCEDVIKSKLVNTVLMRSKIRPKHVPAITQRHVKTIFSLRIVLFKF